MHNGRYIGHRRRGDAHSDACVVIGYGGRNREWSSGVIEVRMIEGEILLDAFVVGGERCDLPVAPSNLN